MAEREKIREGIDKITERMLGNYVSHTERWQLRKLI